MKKQTLTLFTLLVSSLAGGQLFAADPTTERKDSANSPLRCLISFDHKGKDVWIQPHNNQFSIYNKQGDPVLPLFSINSIDFIRTESDYLILIDDTEGNSYRYIWSKGTGFNSRPAINVRKLTFEQEGEYIVLVDDQKTTRLYKCVKEKECNIDYIMIEFINKPGESIQYIVVKDPSKKLRRTYKSERWPASCVRAADERAVSAFKRT